MNILLDGTVPRSAGLSSSSAFVCCAALATAHVNKKNFSKLELADICQKCERYIGTEGGGMDQAISYLAKAGTVSTFSDFTVIERLYFLDHVFISHIDPQLKSHVVKFRQS